VYELIGAMTGWCTWYRQQDQSGWLGEREARASIWSQERGWWRWWKAVNMWGHHLTQVSSWPIAPQNHRPEATRICPAQIFYGYATALAPGRLFFNPDFSVSAGVSVLSVEAFD